MLRHSLFLITRDEAMSIMAEGPYVAVVFRPAGHAFNWRLSLPRAVIIAWLDQPMRRICKSSHIWQESDYGIHLELMMYQRDPCEKPVMGDMYIATQTKFRISKRDILQLEARAMHEPDNQPMAKEESPFEQLFQLMSGEDKQQEDNNTIDI